MSSVRKLQNLVSSQHVSDQWTKVWWNRFLITLLLLNSHFLSISCCIKKLNTQSLTCKANIFLQSMLPSYTVSKSKLHYVVCKVILYAEQIIRLISLSAMQWCQCHCRFTVKNLFSGKTDLWIFFVDWTVWFSYC